MLPMLYSEVFIVDEETHSKTIMRTSKTDFPRCKINQLLYNGKA
jgi:hypothetical protein